MRTALFSVLLLAPALAHAADPLTADTARQILTRKWQALKPQDVTERNVLFQEVTALGSGSFRVTAVIRDYSPGFPVNHYYGQTCASRIPQWIYTITPKTTGEWEVDGRMTPDLSEHKCTPNLAPGLSSIPLESLSGTAAAAGPTPAAPPLQRAGGVVPGPYKCWANGQARMLLNFTIGGPGQYIGSDGKPGAFTFDPATRRIVFTTGALAGLLTDGAYAIYHEPQGRATVSFRSARGTEASFCQK
jgi:hypothetical protein